MTDDEAPFTIFQLLAVISDLWGNISAADASELHPATVRVCQWVHEREWHTGD